MIDVSDEVDGSQMVVLLDLPRGKVLPAHPSHPLGGKRKKKKRKK